MVNSLEAIAAARSGRSQASRTPGKARESWSREVGPLTAAVQEKTDPSTSTALTRSIERCGVEHDRPSDADPDQVGPGGRAVALLQSAE